MSNKPDVVEELLRYVCFIPYMMHSILLTMNQQFVDIGSRECYVAMLYACYDLIQLDAIMEISWRYHLHDYTMVRLFEVNLEPY